MAKKDNKKAKASKPAPKKVAKPAAKKTVAKKPTPKKVVKPVAKKTVAKKVAKAAKPSKPVKVEKKVAKKEIAKASPKKITGKPIDAIKKKGKPEPKSKKAGKKTKKGGDDDDDEDIADEEDDDSDVDVKDDYEKPEDDDVIVGELDEVGLVDLEGADVPEIDEDEDEEPIKRGRGRRKKNEGKSSSGSMESYIRNRPLQVDLSKPLIKKQAGKTPKPFVNTKDNRSRYTDKELAEFKELILEKLKEAQTDYDLLKQTLSNEDNHGTDDTSPTFKLLEDGSDVMSKEETAQLASRQEKYIINLKNALVRIENKSYGICRVTGKLIPKERLRSVPHATLSIDAKLNQSS